MHPKKTFSLCAAVIVVFGFSTLATAQTSAIRGSSIAVPGGRAGLVDEQDRITLRGNIHPMARTINDAGATADNLPMQQMMLALQPGALQQAELERLLAAQLDQASPHFHQWLTPEQFGARFGVSESDLLTVTNWLQSHGMHIDEVTSGRRLILFSGTAGQVASAFQTQIRNYRVNGELHRANATEPQIPRALANVVLGPVSLHDFKSAPQSITLSAPTPNWNSGGSHYLAPADFATIYDVAPLYQSAIDGSGQTVAIVGRSNINLSDVRTFRSRYGLPANDPQIILSGPDPGTANTGEETEAILDVEWSGAVAKNATIKFVPIASTNSSDGVFLSAQYIVNHNVAPVLSVSFGLCEAAFGTSGNAFINSLWQQAAAQGQTVFVSSGDSGAAGCNGGSSSRGSVRGVNALCSSPYSVCVGGTQFADTANPGFYWSASNNGTTQGSALSYIPEVVWNESGSGLWSGGGGVSLVYTKPTWQSAPGVPADGMRDVPDVSLSSSSHDGYLIYMNGSIGVVGGTSAASPSFAGLMALVVQARGAAQGNANPKFYNLATRQLSAGGAAVFHDITGGNNSVPGVTGFNAGVGYDQASGLGSVDASVMVNHWNDASSSPTPSFAIAAGSSLSLAAGASGSITANVSVGGGFNSAVALSVSGLPAGVTATFTPAAFAAPGSGSTTLRLTATNSVVAGTYTVTVTASAGGISKTASVTLTLLPAPAFTFWGSAPSITVTPGGAAVMYFATAGNTSFNSAVALSVTGLPAGVTATLSPASIAAPGSGGTALTVWATADATPRAYSITLTATGGGISHTVAVTLNVPGLTLVQNATSVTVSPGGGNYAFFTTAAVAGFNSATSFVVTGMPSGLATGFSLPTINAPGAGTTTLYFAAAANIVPGSYVLSVRATGGGITKTVGITVNVPGFLLNTSSAVATLRVGSTVNIGYSEQAFAGFGSALSLSVSGLPTGVTASFSPASIVGSGSTTLRLTAASNARIGLATITVTAAGGGITKTTQTTVNVTR
jgi:pseudomonalisin